MQESRNYSALAIELRLSCTNPSIVKLVIALMPLGAPSHAQQNVGWNYWKKCSLGDLSFLRKMGHYFKKNCAYLVSLCLHEQVGKMIVVGWPQFVCKFNVLLIWFCHTTAIASTWQPVPALPARGCHVLQHVIGWEIFSFPTSLVQLLEK